MKKIMIAMISLVTAFSGIAPAQALPLPKMQPVQTQTDVQQVRDRGRIILRRHGLRNVREYRGRDGWNRGRDMRAYRDWRHDRGYRDRRYGWRNDRYYRGGYYRDRGIGIPLGAFAAGAIIGGALNSSRPAYVRPPYARTYVGNSHVAWCSARYRSYRAYDNSYQPYNGPRRQCSSPY